MADTRRQREGTEGRHGIGARVALAVVTSAAAGTCLAAVVAVVAVDRLLAEQADVRLRGAVVELAGELDEDPPERRSAAVRDELNDENREIAPSGIRLAVLDHGAVIAGDTRAPSVAAGSCTSGGAVGQRVRACAEPYGPWVLVASQSTDVERLWWSYVAAALGALLLGAVSGGALSVGLTRWAVSPLRGLARALCRSDPNTPTSIELGPPTRCEEVEAIRTALSELMDRIQVLLDQAQRFAADAAHELRTPLTVMRAELELLAEEKSGTERKALERACARASRLSDLVERLLVLALPGERLAEGFETVSLGDLVNDVVSQLDETRRARVELELGTEGLVRGDVQLLGSLVSNAIGNALKFSKSGPVTVCVEDRACDPDPDPSWVALEVRDMGPGVPAGLRERVFLAFYRARRDRDGNGGHGLGLALIGHIARVHGGRAEFLDVPQGACLLVLLPAWAPANRPESAR
ncbi:MAG: HAMP domain-containing histidine kinase [Polyangiaceae bacterium]|nr:HAMP domain-containing histidine kinase [Polyangiaceae bacterium]